MTTASETYVGIDVGKTFLDVALWGSEEVRRVTNDEAGVTKLMEWITTLKPRLIVVEATGGYEQLAVQTMLLDSQPVGHCPKRPANWRKRT
jgi:transposase